MELQEIYQPISEELKTVEDLLAGSIQESKNHTIRSLSSFLLESPGKRIRPALVILCEKAASVGGNGGGNHDGLIRIATAMELIHVASLIHDDVLDSALIRRRRPSVNARWGDDVSIALGDYIYSRAFELIAKSRDPDVFACVSEAISAMCEGELTQVCQRDNVQLSKDSYLAIVEKKTASLFAACCQAGSIVGNHGRGVQRALRGFGLNFGIAFQIIDDCRDLIGEENVLGRRPGQDVIVGDMTLPLLALHEVIGQSGRKELERLLGARIDQDSVRQIRKMFVDSQAPDLTRKTASSYINRAKDRLGKLEDSDYRDSLICLADYITEGMF